MSNEEIIKQALGLSRESRAFLAEKLLESLDSEEVFDVSPEWMAEIRDRCKEIDEGKAELIAAEQVYEEIERELTGGAEKV
jgi:putative addiction module component (TIGR02574 family)